MNRFSIAALAVCSLALAGAGGCGRNTSSEPTASDATTETAPIARSSDSSSALESMAKEGSPLVRKAVRDFVAERYPDAEIEGVWIVALRSNYCFAAADTTIGTRRRTVEVLVRQFSREDGTDYWRAEGPYADSAAARLLAPRHSVPDFESAPDAP